MALKQPDLTGLRILVVEDTMLIAELIRDELEGCGCTVIGPVGHLDQGLALASDGPLDGAFLDVNLNGESCYPIAEALEGRGVPFVFVTGYDDLATLPPQYRSTPRLSKPFDPHRLAQLATRHFRH